MQTLSLANSLADAPSPARNLLVLYADQSIYTSTVREHLESFRRYSAHQCYYANAVSGASCGLDLEVFDAVVLHYSASLYVAGYLSGSFRAALRRYTGTKVLFVQDEYDNTEEIRRGIVDLGIGLVFTCVPDRYIAAVYPPARFPGVRFVSNLTGYVPAAYEGLRVRRPIAGRRWAIGYRGRPLHYKYGLLGRDKVVIGQRMRAICEQRGIPVDIGWREEERIYWQDWYRFVADCKTTLGTESGSNVFDDHGEIRAAIDRELAARPDAGFDEIHAKFLARHEGAVARMNQVSPRIFEAIALGTALVLFEGEYSSVVQPWEHYIPLRRDFSNVDEVLAAIADDTRLQAMADRAYRDVIEPGTFGYRAFVRRFEDALEACAGPPRAYRVFATVVAAQPVDTRWTLGQVPQEVTDAELLRHIRGPLKVFAPDKTLTNTATSMPMFYMDRHAIYCANTTAAERIAHQLGLGAWARFAIALVLPVWRLVPKGARAGMRNALFRLRG